jgi:predicted Zn-dependent protease
MLPVVLYYEIAMLQNVEYVDALGSILAETGHEKEAVEVLQRAVQLEPDVGFSKYM